MAPTKITPQRLQGFVDTVCRDLNIPPEDLNTPTPGNELRQFLRHLSSDNYLCATRWPAGSGEPPFETDLPAIFGASGPKFHWTVPVLNEMYLLDLWTEEVAPLKMFPAFYRAAPRAQLNIDLTTAGRLSIGILTAGGLAPGLNAVVHQIVRRHELYSTECRARHGTWPKLEILGFKNGFPGLTENLFHYLMSREQDDRRQLYVDSLTNNTGLLFTDDHKNAGGSLIGTGRDDIENPVRLQRAAKNVERAGLDILYCVGGNGTASAAFQLSNHLSPNCKTIVCAVPKTIDNDLLWADYSFGMRTAVDQAVDAIGRMSTEASTTGRIAIVELMGRESGFIAANATLGSGLVDLCLVPEVHCTLEMNSIREHLQGIMQQREKRLGSSFAVVAIAEGCKDKVVKNGGRAGGRKLPLGVDSRTAGGRLLLGLTAKDLHGKRVEAVVHRPGYAIRSCPPSPGDIILCRRLAMLAVDSALQGFDRFMIAPIASSFVLVPLRLVAEPRVGGVGGPKQINPSGRFWREVAARTNQSRVDESCRA